MAERNWGFRTRAVHAGGGPTRRPAPEPCRSTRPPASCSRTPADAADLFALQKYGNIYSRIGNPTVAAFEERMASLEGGIGAVATASGQAAEFLTFAALAEAGDHIVVGARPVRRHASPSSTSRCAGSAWRPRSSAGGDPADYAAAIPTGDQGALHRGHRQSVRRHRRPRGAGRMAHAAGMPLVVDATLATPYLCRPIEHGADIVRALGDEVHRRPRHDARRRGRRVRAVRLGQRAASRG